MIKIKQEPATQKIKPNDGYRRLGQPVYQGTKPVSGGPAGGFSTTITTNRTTGKY